MRRGAGMGYIERILAGAVPVESLRKIRQMVSDCGDDLVKLLAYCCLCLCRSRRTWVSRIRVFVNNDFVQVHAFCSAARKVRRGGEDCSFELCVVGKGRLAAYLIEIAEVEKGSWKLALCTLLCRWRSRHNRDFR